MPGDTTHERPFLLVLLASIGYLGCVSLVAGTFVAQNFVPHHDWIADTISDLAAGQWEIVMDVALYGFAAGLMAAALASAHAHLGRGGWSAGLISLAILAALVTTIGARNEYGDSDTEGVVIHVYLVYGVGIFMAIASLGMATGAGNESVWARRALIGLGLLWLIAAPVFFFLPTDVDGLYERLLGLIAVAIVCTLSTVFLRRGLAKGRQAGGP